MTTTEVLIEIQKMPLTEKRQVFQNLNEQLDQAEKNRPEREGKKIVNGLRQKG